MKLINEEQVMNYLKEYLATGKDKAYITHIIKDENTKKIEVSTDLFELGTDLRFDLMNLENETNTRITGMELDIPNATLDPYPHWYIYSSPVSAGMSEYYKHMGSK